MSVVHLQQVEILNSSAAFADPYIFKITFECISELSEDIEWRLIYVGSAEDEKYDQELDNCLVGPVPVGVNSFEFEAAAPSPAKIPAEDLLGVTVILLTGSYREQEFIRVGYYVNNEYETLELRENPPDKVDLTRVKREVLVSKPRVTRFNIKWDNPAAATTGEPLAGEITQDADGNDVGGSGSGAGSSGFGLGSSASVAQGETPAEALGKTTTAAAGGSAAAVREQQQQQQQQEDDEAASAAAAASSFKPVSVSS